MQLNMPADRALLYAFLRRQRYGVVSSLSPAGMPQSALVGIAVTPDLDVVFDTVQSSRKFPNLIARPTCSLVIGWEGEQTVQLEGIAKHLTSPALEQYESYYFSAWPECRAHLTWPGIAYFAVKPVWIRYSDYGQNPPLIQEFALPAS